MLRHVIIHVTFVAAYSELTFISKLFRKRKKILDANIIFFVLDFVSIIQTAQQWRTQDVIFGDINPLTPLEYVL